MTQTTVMPERTAQARFFGENMPLFRLAMFNGVLSLLTLGIYRFWGKTKIRKYLWNSAEVDGDRFEYTGTGREKFLGFLFALVVLAVYMAVVQLIFFGIGLRFVARPRSETEVFGQLIFIYSTFFALMPLIAFARYRARRYKMARTRFRGIRFGMDNEAWGYTWRSVGLTVLSILSLGLLHPYQRFTLEKYMTDRGYFGDAKFEQRGKWTALYRNMKHIFIGFGIMIAGAIFGAIAHSPVLTVFVGAIGYAWAIIGVLSYNVQNFAYLTSNKALSNGVGLSCQMKTSRVIGIYLIGTLITGLITLGFAIVFFALAAITSRASGVAFTLHTGPGVMPSTFVVVLMGLAYLALLVMTGAAGLAFMIQPIIGYVVQQVVVQNAEGLASVRQRAADSGADADGFADALDLGGAF